MSQPKQPPPNLITRVDIPTPSGTLSVTTSLPTSPPATSQRFDSNSGQPITPPDILFIHGNSCSSQIFQHFFFPPTTTSTSPPLCATHRLITFDLPGHGESQNAPNTAPPSPYSSHYTMPAYALATLAVLNHLQITKVVVLGWSLGGHIGMELLPLLNPPDAPPAHRRMKGLCLTGTPPVPRSRADLGFHLQPDGTLGYAEREALSDEECAEMAKFIAGVAVGGENPPWIEAGVRRTVGASRSEMCKAFRAGEGLDQKELVEKETDVLVAVINGTEEVVKLDYLDKEVKWGRLWKGQCVRLPGLGHTPFWEDFGTYEKFFKEFVEECTYL